MKNTIMKNKTIGDIHKDIGFSAIYQASILHFSQTFGIKLDKFYIGSTKYFVSYAEIREELYEFFIAKKDKVIDYHIDYYKLKTPVDVSQKIDRTPDQVINVLKKRNASLGIEQSSSLINESSHFKYISSFDILSWIDNKKYIYKLDNRDQPKSDKPKDISESSTKGKPVIDSLLKVSIIGYEDVKEDILEQLEAIINPHDAKDWGLKKPGGILLYGPPGCGKTHWANWIASLLNYNFEEVPRSVFGSSLVDGAMNNLKKLLDEIKQQPKTILFFDEFDSIAGIRNSMSSGSQENSKVVNTLLQEIPKLIEKDVLIIAATNFVNYLDPAVIRPGRFDLKIPIFPPTPDERIKLLIHSLLSKLNPNSPLLKIIKNNKADCEEFWLPYMDKMCMFSNSLILDLSELIKKRVKKIFKSMENGSELQINEELICGVISDAAGKITKQDAEMSSNFYTEVTSLGSNIYGLRAQILLAELKNYYKKDEDPPRPVGFRLPYMDK